MEVNFGGRHTLASFVLLILGLLDLLRGVLHTFFIDWGWRPLRIWIFPSWRRIS